MNENFSRLLLLSAIGIMMLSLMATRPPERESISSLNKADVGEKTMIRAEIVDVFENEESDYFLELDDGTSNISAVDFDSRKNYVEGDELLVIGRTQLHEGNHQIIIKESSTIPS